MLVSGYNFASHIQNVSCMLDMLLKQEDVSVVFVNDGSTDKSEQTLLDFKTKNLKVISNHRNMGLTKSLILGANLIESGFIVRWDVDDWFGSDRIEEIKKLACQGYEFIASNTVAYNPQIEPVRSFSAPRCWNSARIIGLYRNPFVHGACAFSKNLYSQTNGYNDAYTYAQDYEYWSRLFMLPNVQYSQGTKTYNLTLQPNSISVVKQKEQRSNFKRARKAYWKNFLTHRFHD